MASTESSGIVRLHALASECCLRDGAEAKGWPSYQLLLGSRDPAERCQVPGFVCCPVLHDQPQVLGSCEAGMVIYLFNLLRIF